MTPIAFTDEDGIRWTVELPWRDRPGEASPAPGPTEVEFLSETGEHRTYTVLALEEAAWDGVNELAWRILLQRARTGRICGGFLRSPPPGASAT